MLLKNCSKLATILLALPLAGCGLFSSSDPHEPAELQSITQSVSTKTVWSTSVGKSESAYMVPAVTDNAVYAAGGKTLYRLSRDNGSKVWSADLKGSFLFLSERLKSAVPTRERSSLVRGLRPIV